MISEQAPAPKNNEARIHQEIITLASLAQRCHARDDTFLCHQRTVPRWVAKGVKGEGKRVLSIAILCFKCLLFEEKRRQVEKFKESVKLERTRRVKRNTCPNIP
ncbi:hypothetical protein JTE90_004001 [Oedothorax gibbosus]|uniref:Uncharacterized protein n=1 Tax=Oedothorax gibbosus TaxID=931172 RepID=A0AAV6UDN5_9ARAC|nr:hypothetical protein JTE90_004001 [Oedothorax gibbosus]